MEKLRGLHRKAFDTLPKGDTFVLSLDELAKILEVKKRRASKILQELTAWYGIPFVHIVEVKETGYLSR